jgi:hypothetical protein
MVRVRPLEVDDGDAPAALDAHHAARAGHEPVATRGALSFYARSGHAFVAEDGEGVRGFAFAQAVWDGTRPTVQLQTLATEAADAEARAALLEAVTKSAYDAAVYDLVARAPHGDPALHELLEREGWRAEPVSLLRRTLGSRGAS